MDHTVDFAIRPENSVSRHGDTVPDDKETVVRARFAKVYRRVRHGTSLANTKVKEESYGSNIPNNGLHNILIVSIKEEQDQSMCNELQRPRRLCSMIKITIPSISKKKRGRRRDIGDEGHEDPWLFFI